MNQITLTFARYEKMSLCNFGLLTLRTHLNESDALAALKKAVTQWVATTERGQRCWNGTCEDLNIGDLVGELDDEHLLSAMKTHGVEYVDSTVMSCDPIEYDTVLVNEEDLESKSPDSNGIVFLTNAVGEVTGFGPEPTQEDYAKVAFEEGPGSLRTYIAMMGNQKYLVAIADVCYQDPFWGSEASDMPTHDAAKKEANAILHRMRRNLRGTTLERAGVRACPESDCVSDGDHEPGRFNVACHVPLSHIVSAEHGQLILAYAFGLFEPAASKGNTSIGQCVSTMWADFLTAEVLTMSSASVEGQMIVERLKRAEKSPDEVYSGLGEVLATYCERLIVAAELVRTEGARSVRHCE